MKPEPLASLIRLDLPPPSTSDKTADADRLIEGLKRIGIDDVNVPVGVIRPLSKQLREDVFSITAVVGLRGDRVEVLDIGRERIFGIALDLGSTNLVCLLYDLKTGEVCDRREAENPQVRYGADVLTRVQRSMFGEYGLLRKALIDGVNRLIATICGLNGVGADEVFALTAAGNTIISHFFLGVDVDNIPLSPYIPAVNRSVVTSGHEVGLDIHPRAVVYVFPNAGSYVGGDIISGILFSGLHKEENPVLFIDVGTNVEVTLGCRDWIMVGAGAAGPALEGGVAGIGRTASKGTIRSIGIDNSGSLTFDMIDGGEPAGICGSGLIDLISALYSSGIIDRAGRFKAAEGRVFERDGEMAYLLHKGGGGELWLTEKEIGNFLLSKAAMFSFLYVFMRAVGIGFRDIPRYYMAGALGCGINPESAVAIGMLPDVPRERFVPLGNSSIGGAGMVLLDRRLTAEVEDIASRITYREMNEDGALMQVLQGALFIPHTDPAILKGL